MKFDRTDNVYNYILLILIFLSSYKLGRIQENKKEKNRNTLESRIEYKTENVKRGFIKVQKHFIGKIVSQNSTTLKTNIQGHIESIVNEGNQVEKDEVLIQLVDKDAKYKLNSIESIYKYRMNEEKNAKELLEKELISESEYNKILCEFEESKGKYLEALNYFNMHKIKAPFAGKVSLQKQSVGSIVNYNTELVTLTANEDYEIIIDIPSKFSKEIDFEKCLYEVITTNGSVNAKLHCVDNEINTTTNTLSIKLKLENNEDIKINPNDMFKVVLTFGKKSNVVVVNKNAVFYIQEKAYIIKLVKTKEDSYTCIKQEVTVGEKNNILIEIISGIKEGDIILLDNQYCVFDGQSVGGIK